jgi:hypothetical protein
LSSTRANASIPYIEPGSAKGVEIYVDLTRDDDSVVYVTLIEAAEEIGASPSDLRRAVLDQQIDGIKENPRNRRSRWLVPIDAVRSLYSAAPTDDDAASTDAGPSGADVSVSMIHGGALSGRGYPDVMDGDTAGPVARETADLSDQGGHDAAGGSITVWDEPPSGDAAVLLPGRGAEMIDRLSLAIDRFAAAIPEPLFDYQELLDKYVAAVERQADAEALSASRLREIEDLQKKALDYQELLERYVAAMERSAEAEARAQEYGKKIEDMEAETSAALEKLGNLEAENRRLMTELAVTRSQADLSRSDASDVQPRPMWRRRIRRAADDAS